MDKLNLNNNLSLRADFFKETRNNQDIIILRVQGEYGVGSSGNINGRYLSSLVAAAFFRWKFEILLFDFSHLKYEMSDSLNAVFTTLNRLNAKRIQQVIIVSEENENAIQSLLSMIQYEKKVRLIRDIEEL